MERIIGLNVRSGGGERAPGLCRYLERQSPDTVVLTEWRASTRALSEWAAHRQMHEKGFRSAGTLNGTFVASRTPFESENVTPSGPSAGCLMLARFPDMVLLACYFPQKTEKVVFFARCLEIARKYEATPFILIGDLNTGNQAADRNGTKFYCSDGFDRLSSEGGLIDLWRRCNGTAREWTWLSGPGNGFRIDHAFANAAFVAAAQPTCTYDHEPRTTRLTDHSAVVVETARIAG